MPRLAYLPVLPLLFLASAASAAPIDWNTWSTPGAGVIANDGTPITVTFTTDNRHDNIANYPLWSPGASFMDGLLVDNGPAPANGIMKLFDGSTAISTVSFSSPVVDPVMAIWSLGAPSRPASFDFISLTPMLVAGGPNAEYGGASISVLGTVVSGTEGNGTVQFAGTYSSLSWTNPQAENWYGFNVGIAAAVPEPTEAAMLLIGLAALAFRVRRS